MSPHATAIVAGLLAVTSASLAYRAWGKRRSAIAFAIAAVAAGLASFLGFIR